MSIALVLRIGLRLESNTDWRFGLWIELRTRTLLSSCGTGWFVLWSNALLTCDAFLSDCFGSLFFDFEIWMKRMRDWGIV